MTRYVNPDRDRQKNVIRAFLQLYKNFPCLWDQKHELYTNREARDRAYDVLLEEYKLFKPQATLTEIKKKIENMRSAYRRDHKKVLKAKLEGTVYEPHLWYYNCLTFLNENNGLDQQDELEILKSMVSKNSNVEKVGHDDDGGDGDDGDRDGGDDDGNEGDGDGDDGEGNDSYQDVEELEDDIESEEETIPRKRKKTSNNSFNAVFMSESDVRTNLEVGQDTLAQFEKDIDPPQTIVNNETEAFGRTVGFQLKELTHKQRIYAEKLISDVMFQARLGQLNAHTTLNLNID